MSLMSYHESIVISCMKVAKLGYFFTISLIVTFLPHSGCPDSLVVSDGSNQYQPTQSHCVNKPTNSGLVGRAGTDREY